MFNKYLLISIQFSDTMDYFMRDDENEKCFGYNLKYSILRARCRKIFQVNYIFPGVNSFPKQFFLSIWSTIYLSNICLLILQDVMFYLTPSVEPSYSALSSLIILAGGKVLEDKPQPQFVIRCIEVLLPFNVVE